MKIDSIKIKNYRTLEDLTVNFPGYYSTISGKNNSGKTNIFKVIEKIFGTHKESYFNSDKDTKYSKDKTQWKRGTPDIEFIYNLTINKDQDSGFYKFIEDRTGNKIKTKTAPIKIKLNIDKAGKETKKVYINSKDIELDTYYILSKLRETNILFSHNSSAQKSYSYRASDDALHEFSFTLEEEKKIAKRQNSIKSEIKKLVNEQKGDLVKLLGHLEDKFEVELNYPDKDLFKSIPLVISLKDKNVEVPLSEWGSGTKNRTRILLSILEAERTKSYADDENKITPIVIIEEPESFLHPSAQAEFGCLLNELATNLEVQVIVTTHSPHILSKKNPSANILLERRVDKKGNSKKTFVMETDKQNWMRPFAENLGLNDEVFEGWKEIFTTKKDLILLVEGGTDKEYLEHIDSLGLPDFKIPKDVEILPYNGIDSLKRKNPIIKFALGRFHKIFVTFDLDAKGTVKGFLDDLQYEENKHFMALGKSDDGNDCIEGLVPEEIISNVGKENPNAIKKLANSKDKKQAKREWKRLVCDKFKEQNDYTKEDLGGFSKLFKNLNKAFTA